MIETTKQISRVLLCDNVLRKVIRAEVYKKLRDSAVSAYTKAEEEFFSYYWIPFTHSDSKGYYNTRYNVAVPVQSAYTEAKEKYFNRECSQLSKEILENIFDKNCPQEILSGIAASKSKNGGHWVGNNEFSYCIETGQYSGTHNDDVIPLGIVHISLADFKKSILAQSYRIEPDKLFAKAAEITGDKSSERLSEKEVDELISLFGTDREKIEKETVESVLSDFVLTDDGVEMYRDILLSCDKVRADLDKYDRKCLEDVNSGHWDLWTEEEPEAEKGQIIASLEKPLTARNPEADIHYDGLIGIDFGTKSTIVSKQDGKEKTSLIRVGIGQLEKAALSHHYENPTILEFRDLEKFMSDYTSRDGRPDTSIDDLRVSHSAEYDLKTLADSDDFYSYFYDIKQWCTDTERSVRITDQKGRERVLPAFADIAENEFDPLELYAYYLGLYINNMRNGIYLDYIMSFPVTYDKAVKEKIIESFARGLKKSLPETIIRNEEVMSHFRVRQGVSEPAAYAITALQGYGFEPEDDEKVYYSIFDFGGGTTDFDFGLWRASDESKREEERFDYVIEHLGSEGDKNLGGENLLELMAFEIFRANTELLGATRKNTWDQKEEVSAGFSFTKPKECDEFPGSETFISNSQEAKRNTKQLMEALRPFWEGIYDIDIVSDSESDEEERKVSADSVSYGGYIFRNTECCRFPFADGSIEVDLFDKDGNRRPKQKLYIYNPKLGIKTDLIEIIERRIEKGVSNFFTSLGKVFNSENMKSGDIQIFLAGNSSQSPVLGKIFSKYIESSESSVKFHLYPPLGTKNAAEIQREKGIRIMTDDVSAPSGKTGVAYGLIAGRDGGKIKVLSEAESEDSSKFRFNIGSSKRGRFSLKLDRNEADHSKWIRFIDAGSEDFEIYYSSLPNAARMSIDEAGIYKKRCRIASPDPDKDVFIRCADNSPEDIEFCIADTAGPGADAKTVRVHLED